MIRIERTSCSSLRLAAAFLRRDFLFEMSYKLQMLFKVVDVLFRLMIFYFLSRLVGGDASRAALEEYGGDYFTFSLVGIAFLGFFNAGIINFTTSIRQQLTIGVLEALAVAPIRSATLLFYSSIWPMGFELAKAIFYLIAGKLFFGAELSLVRVPLFLVTLALSVVVFGCLGVVGASLIVYFKRGDPIAWILSSLSILVGGVLFPIVLLPNWLQLVARANPVTYALEALRTSLIPRATGGALATPILVLSVFVALFIPLALWSAQIVFEKARAEGNLGLH